MSQNLDIELKPVIPKEYPTFIKNLQEAFSPAIIEKFGTNEYLPSKIIPGGLYRGYDGYTWLCSRE